MITIKNGKKIISQNLIFKDVNLCFEDHKIYELKGINGSGKSVFLKCLCGFMKMDDGEIIIDGKRIRKDINFIENAGLLLNTEDFVREYTGYENLKIIAEMKNSIGKKEIYEWAKMFKLENHLNKKIKYYSLGMKQKLSLIQAFMEHPKILILDEPFNALDQQTIELVVEILKAFHKRGSLIIFTNHQIDIGDTLICERLKIENGRIA